MRTALCLCGLPFKNVQSQPNHEKRREKKKNIRQTQIRPPSTEMPDKYSLKLSRSSKRGKSEKSLRRHQG